MRYFDHLRTTPWQPEFEWFGSAEEAADIINCPHEDYPTRVERTVDAINLVQSHPQRGMQEGWVSREKLWRVHRIIFSDKAIAGQQRTVNVRVGLHYPPPPSLLHPLMQQLEKSVNGKLTTIQALRDWYTDFETIHPFQDGNGRVGGVIIACYSHYIEPENGWLAPLQ